MNARALLASLLIFCSSAHATLVDVPGQNYSQDTATGLRWLDPSFTGGLGFSEASLIPGWRHATQSELTGLFSSEPVPGLINTFGGPNVGGDTSLGLQSFIALVGIYAPGPDGQAWLGVANWGATDFGFGNPFQSKLFSGPIGNFLVSPVPEPSTYLMMAMGLLALAIGRRKARYEPR